MASEQDQVPTKTVTGVSGLPARAGKYRIVGKIGQGGMGVVFRAVDDDLNRTVALKFIPAELDRADAEERFLREARAASALDHVNIGAIFGIEETEDARRFIVMAFYEGESVAQRLRDRERPLTPSQAVEIAIQTARGLVAAHARGVVHRDIKPSNLLLTESGVVKIVDFGVASMAGAAQLTRPGSSMGTPAYMSPEQAAGKPVDARTDIWSLGLMLLEMLTGKCVFQGSSAPQVLYQVVHADVRPLSAVDGPMRAILAHALERDLARRFPSMAEFLAALESVNAAEVAVRPLARAHPKRRFALAAAMTVLLAVAAFCTWRFAWRPPIPGAPSSPTIYGKYLRGIDLLKRWDKGTNLQQAGALFTDATRSDPKFALGFAALAESQRLQYALTHDKALLESAAANAEQAMRLHPNLTRVQVVWGRIQSLRGNNDLAISSFERALEIDPNNADAHGALARQYERLGRLTDAEAEHQKALTLDPDSMFLHDAYANFLFRQSRYAEAEREWREVARIAPDNSATYVNLGAALSDSGNSAAAIEMYQRAVKLKPNTVAYSNLGLAYYHERRYPEAVEALQEALKLSPNYAAAWRNLGYVRSRMSGLESEAKEAFRRSIQLAEQDRNDSPRDPEVNAGLALCYAKIGESAMARRRIETGLALAPKTPSILAEAAEVYLITGERPKALDYAKQALQLGYPSRRLESNPDLEELLPNLK